MKLRTSMVLGVLMGIAIGACGSDPPPAPAPAPEAATPNADSAAAAAAARLEAEREAAARAAAAERQRGIDAAKAALTEMVFFEYNMATLTTEAQRNLRTKVDILRATPSVRLRIEGHADERGSTEYNIALGQRRAESVREFFTSFGLDDSRFSLISYGEERPLDSGSSERSWQRNRRAAFTITAGENDIEPLSR